MAHGELAEPGEVIEQAPRATEFVPEEGVTEPVPEESEEVEAPAEEAPSEEQAEIDYQQWVAERGGEEGLQKAIDFQKYLESPEGAIDYFIESGLRAGLNADQIEALFADEAAPAQEAEPSFDRDDPDRVLTVGDFERLLNERVVAPQEEERQARASAEVQQIVTTEVNRLGLPERVIPLVLNLADSHLDEHDRSPEAITAAIHQGYEDWQAIVTEDSKRYVEKKVASAAASPRPLKGGSPGGSSAVDENLTLAEQKERVRKRLRELGELT